MVITSAASTILVGIPSGDADTSKEVLSCAITILARPGDTIVALLIIVGEEQKKLTRKFRQAKAFLISLTGEFANACHSKQVQLEARVRYSSSVETGLLDEAIHTSAHLLLVATGSASGSQLSKRIHNHAPTGCSVVWIGCSGQPAAGKRSDTYVISAVKVDDSPRMALGSRDQDHSSSSTISSGGSGSFSDESPPHNYISLKQKHNISPAALLQLLSLKHIRSFLRLANFDPKMNPTKLMMKNNYNDTAAACNIHEKLAMHGQGQGQGQPSLRCFSYEEISAATNDFHPENMIGRGGYSEVYRGISDIVNYDDGSGGGGGARAIAIAVKRLANKAEEEFLVEIGIIGHVSHPNTASLIGYCIENGLYLIFRFCPNGNLATALHGDTNTGGNYKSKKPPPPLEWAVRYKVVMGVARGLHYLHNSCKHRIIHRDIKASNILLGPDYEPQIADFGLAKWLPSKWTHHAGVPLEGTFGYLAPEYFLHGIVDEKIDVFAFGILLLEIITGRRPLDCGSKQNLLQWAMPFMESGEESELVDARLKGKYNARQLQNLVLTASHCVRRCSLWRPSMAEVLELLTEGHNSAEVVESWRMPNVSADEFHYDSMAFGTHVNSDNLHLY